MGTHRCRRPALAHTDLFTETLQTSLSPTAGPAYPALLFQVSAGTGGPNEERLCKPPPSALLAQLGAGAPGDLTRRVIPTKFSPWLCGLRGTNEF